MQPANPRLPGLDGWTRFVGGAGVSAGPVVVVPPDADPSEGIRLALAITTHALPVRLVMRGATTSDTISALPEHLPLILTELDAYLPADKGPLIAPLLAGLESWLSFIFQDAIADIDVASAFWGSAVTRLGLQDVFDAWVLANGIADAHRGAQVHLTDASWVGVDMLAKLGVLAAGAAPARRPTGLLPVAALAALGVTALRLVELLRERKTRSVLRAHRSPSAEPTVWLGVIGHWEFSSRHVLASLGAAAKERGQRIGVLLESSLSAGAITDAHRSKATATSVLPVLASEHLAGAWSHVDQLVSADSLLSFVLSVPATLVAMLRAIGRFSTKPVIDFASFQIAVPPTRSTLAALTLDVLRGREAAAATRRFIARHDVAGAHIALSHASLVTDAVPDLILQRAGAVTFDVVHGALAEPLDMVGTARTFSSNKLLWTVAEAEMLQPSFAGRCVGGVPSRRWERRSSLPKTSTPVRVLVLSNYATRIWNHRKRLARVVYQHHLLNDLAAAIERTAEPIEVRWRPHPGDDKEAIKLELTRHHGVAQSKDTLEADLEWADVIVSSLSSTVVEALQWEKPLLMHDIPLHEASVLMSLFPAARRFRNADELTGALNAALTDARSGAPLAPEAVLRRTFFGETGLPSSISEVVFGASESQKAP